MNASKNKNAASLRQGPAADVCFAYSSSVDSVAPKKPVVKACAIPQCDQPAEAGRMHCAAAHQPALITTPFLDRANILTSRGIRVVPVNAREKRCTLSGWPQLATTSLEEIAAWAQNPDFNTAAVTKRGEVLVLDCDVPAVRERIEHETGQSLPRTFTVSSGGKGLPHFYLGATAKSDAAGNLNIPGVGELKVHNSYVVGPGSVITRADGSQGVYEITDDSPIAPAPDWFIDWCVRNGTRDKERGNSKAIPIVDDFDICALLDHYGLGYEVDGNYYVTDVCPVAGRKHEQSTKTGFYYDGQTFGFSCFAANCPGHDMTVGDVIKHLNKGDGLVIRQPYAGPIWLKQEETPVLDLTADYSCLADDFLKEELPARNPIITSEGANLFYEKSVNEVFAFRGIGKSLFTNQVIRLATRGGEWLRYFSKGGKRVLLIDGELPLQVLQERLREQVGDTGGLLRFISPEKMPNHRLPALSAQAGQDWLMAQIDRHKPDVLVIDTLTACFKFDTNDPDLWLSVNDFLIRLRMMGLCTVMAHHAGKNGTQRGRTDGDDNLDLIVKLEPPKGWEPGDGAHFRVCYEKVRSGDRVRPFEAKLEPFSDGLVIGQRWVEPEEDPLIEGAISQDLWAGMPAYAIATKHGVRKQRVTEVRKKLQAQGVQLPTNKPGPKSVPEAVA